MTVKLPYIEAVKLKGYGSMFKTEDVLIEVNKHLTVLLGGNGLGKTTILQSLIFGLAGGLDSAEIESQTNYRWTHNFFKKRVLDRSNAYVEVSFNLGSANFIVERNLSKSTVTRLSVKNEKIVNVYVDNEAKNEYERLICEHGSFNNIDDFRFLVHRLLYLPENRRGITWDLDAQVRILMLLNNDVVDEKDFRQRRSKLKELDSTKRHLNVRINKIKNILQEREVPIDNAVVELEDYDEQEEYINNNGILYEDDRKKTTQKLKELINAKNTIEKNIVQLDQQEGQLRAVIFDLSESQKTFEAQLISQSLQQSNVSSDLYLRKLLDYGLCPSCGTKSSQFQKLALQRVTEGYCPICGTVHDSNLSIDEMTEVHSQLEEKMKAKLSIDNEISNFRYQYRSIQNEISHLETELELSKYNAVSQPTILQNFAMNPNNLTNTELTGQLDEQIKAHEYLALLIEKESTHLDIEYRRYIESSERNINRLSELFSNFAYEFLGSKVSLQERTGGDRFLGITLFNPVFNDVVRESPEDCSEAQRFFLDIAMRLAMLHLAYELTGCENTFICETPESALDVSYIDNAARMFRKFIQNGHSLIASTNLQRLGLAHKLVEYGAEYPVEPIVFDLLEIGYLSDVQRASKELEIIRNEIMEAAKSDLNGAD